MKVIKKVKKEKEILIAVTKKAKPVKIYEGMISRAECCVVHLCGCS